MTLLLDTHVWLWMVAQPERLGAPALELIESTANRLLLSAASSWEISIKYAIGRLRLPDPPELFVPDRMRVTGVEGLAVEHSHAVRVAGLEHHHRDPFDRLLVAQAQVENVALISADRVFDQYEIDVVPAG